MLPAYTLTGLLFLSRNAVMIDEAHHLPPRTARSSNASLRTVSEVIVAALLRV
jgi:hypothetical protein